MKKIILKLLVLGGSILLFYSCEKEFFGNKNCDLLDGPIVNQEVDLSVIHSMDIEVPVELIISESAVQEITIESSQSVIDAILDDSFVRNEEWNVQLNGCNNVSASSNAFPVKIFASLTSLQEIKIAGVGTARSAGVFKNIDNLKLEIEGSADFDFILDTVQNLATKINGLGEFKLSGFADHYTIDISGSGDVKAFDLIANTCEIKVDGLGDCEVTVQGTLTIDLSGKGNVCYKGQPELNVDNRGDGEVKSCN